MPRRKGPRSLTSEEVARIRSGDIPADDSRALILRLWDAEELAAAELRKAAARQRASAWYAEHREERLALHRLRYATEKEDRIRRLRERAAGLLAHADALAADLERDRAIRARFVQEEEA